MNEATISVPREAEKCVFQVTIHAPIERVWSELVKTGSPLPFFFNGVCDTPGLAPGASFRMVTKNGKYTSVVGQVLAFEPPHRYAHTLKFTSYDDPPCKVIYELLEVDDGVEFTLTCEGVPSGTKTEKSMDQGGTFIVNNLKALCETGKPTFSGQLILAMIGLTTPFSPKRLRTENWPFPGQSGGEK